MENTAILASSIFILMYVVIVSEKIHRTIAAMLGAVGMLFTGIITQETALHHIDFNTLGLLTGMMIIVYITGRTGLFNYIAIRAAQMAKAEPVKILIYLSLLTAVFSALLDNVTTVLLMVPVTLEITRKLEVDPMPYLIVQILASNIGGTATLIGDPPNIMIGSAVKELTFNSFIDNLAGIAFINLVIVIVLLTIWYRKSLHTTPERQFEIMKLIADKELVNISLLKKCLFVMLLTITGFFLHQLLNLESAVIALSGAFLLLLITNKEKGLIEKALEKVEWVTIFFFIGLFIAVGALIETGIIKQIAEYGIAVTGGELSKTALLILWLSAITSAFLDNIPFVATMIPLIQDMGQMGVDNLLPLWWSLALGACLGGNGTIVGASANLIVAGIAAEHGHPISFMRFFKVGFPIMLLTVVIASIYIYLRYL